MGLLVLEILIFVCWEHWIIDGIKVKFSLCFFFTEHHAMKAYLGSEGIAPHIL
jgi:hypothetical protein